MASPARSYSVLLVSAAETVNTTLQGLLSGERFERVTIASIRDRASRDDLIDELIDRFGDPNRPVMNLIDMIL